jgi:HPt (histidine-containing phosphotransfer) domain-containing protein
MSEPLKPTLQQSPAPSPLDDSMLREYLGDDNALMHEVLQQFLDTLTTDLQQLESEMSENNVASVQRSAHRLKGASYMVGARPLGNSAMALEDLARTGKSAGFDTAWNAIATEHLRILRHLAAQNLSPTPR